jgi:hypothetical protein
MYVHDVAHCGEKKCPLYEKCYRGFLDRSIKKTEWQYATYFRPEKTGKECEYFLDLKNY